MSIKNKACIAGAFEHPTRLATDKSVAQLHAECAAGALADAGLSFKDVDAYYCAGDAPGGALSMMDYMGIRQPRQLDSTESGGTSYLLHVIHAAQAIAAGHCDIALITLAGRPRSTGRKGTIAREKPADVPEAPYEQPYSPVTLNQYAMAAMRHMHEFGTTSEQLAWAKVSASHHSQHNPNAFLRKVLTVEDVLNSPMLADPLRRMDACVVTDGGGALVVVRPEIARSLSKGALKRPVVNVLGGAHTSKNQAGSTLDLTYTGAVFTAPRAFEEAGITRADIKYASIYDSFTIMVAIQLEDLGFCKKGEGGKFMMDGNLISGVGRFPINTDGGGLCNNHPVNRGGMTKVIEAVRQLRGEAHPKVQVKNCDFALMHGNGGGMLTGRHGSATLILGRE